MMKKYICKAKQFVNKVLFKLGETFFWIVFKIVLPGAPFFMALFVDHFVQSSLHEELGIVIKSDVFLLGASIASTVFESSIQPGYFIGRFGILLSFLSLLFFLGIFFILCMPNIEYLFRSVRLEENFWHIMVIAGGFNIVLGILGDVVFPAKKLAEQKNREA